MQWSPPYCPCNNPQVITLCIVKIWWPAIMKDNNYEWPALWMPKEGHLYFPIFTVYYLFFGKNNSSFVFLPKLQGHVVQQLKPQCTSVFSEWWSSSRINLPDHSHSPGVSSIWAQFLWAAPGMNWNSTPEQPSRRQSLQEMLLFIHPNAATVLLRGEHELSVCQRVSQILQKSNM